MSNEEMFSAIMVRMDTMQGSLNGLNSRMDCHSLWISLIGVV